MLGQHFHLAQRTGAERHPAIPKASVTDKNRSDSATVRSQTRLRSAIKAPSASLKDAVPGSQPLAAPEPRSVDFFFSSTPKLSFPSGICPLGIQNTNAGGLCSQLPGTRLQRSSWVHKPRPWCAPPRCSHLRSQGSEIGERGGLRGLGREEHKRNPPLIPPSAEIGRARALAPANGRVPGRAWKTAVQAI